MSWDFQDPQGWIQTVTKSNHSRTLCESVAKEGDSPVGEMIRSVESIPSTIEHEKFVGNLGGPPSKAKYSLMTDSEQVP